MKKWIVWLLVCLLLAGCGAQELPEEETTLPPETTLASAPPQLYVADSAEEVASEGALRAYALESDLTHQVFPAENGVFLVTNGGGKTILRLYKGENLELVAEKEVSTAKDGSWKVHTKGNAFSCYEEESRTYTFFNAALQETGKVVIPEDAVGATVLSADLQRIYYVTETAIRIWDRSTNTPRPLREGTAGTNVLVGLLHEDTQLCYARTLNQAVTYLTVDAQTGQIISESEEEPVLNTGADTYYNLTDENKLVFGKTDDDAATCLELPDGREILEIHKESGLVLARRSGEPQTLLCVDLTSGKKVAQITLPDGFAPTILTFDKDGNQVWLLQGSRLLCWQTEKSSVEEDNVYTAPLKENKK